MKAKTALLLFLLLIPLSFFSQTKEIRELEAKKAKIQEDMKATEALLEENKKASGDINIRIGLIRSQIESRKEMIKTLDQEVGAINTEINSKKKQIRLLEKELNKKKQNYAETVETMYVKRNQSNRLLFILSANDFSQALRRIVYLKEYSNFHKAQADDIARNQSILTAEKHNLEKNKEKKLAVLDTRKEEEAKLSQQEKEYGTEAKNLSSMQRKIQADLTKKQKEILAINKEIDQKIAEEIAKAEAARKAREEENKAKLAAELSSASKSNTPATPSYQQTKEDLALSANFGDNKGKLPFPIKGKYKIINKFGVNKDNTSPLLDNKGIDILTLKDTEALAVFDGEVIYTGMITHYLVVLIQHGKYYTFYQNFDQVYVKVGNKVKKGQALGTVKTDIAKGEGTILHFGIRENKKALNPEHWLNK